MSVQKILNGIAEHDKQGFLEGVDNWCNHRPMLLLALSLTTGPVAEFGAGDGSTNYLRQYCNDSKRLFRSFDSNSIWAHKCGADHIADWDSADIYHPCGLAFIDHAPGEHRHIAIERMAGKADIIVVHDSEEGGSGNYMLDKIWHLFKYRLNYNKTGGGAGTSAISNMINVQQFAGSSLGKFQFDHD